MSSVTAKKKIPKKTLALYILKHDGLFFHVLISDFSTVEGMTKSEIENAGKRYKNLNIIFANNKVEEKYNQKDIDKKFKSMTA